MASIDSMTKMYKICNDQVNKLRPNVKNLSKSIGDVSGVSKLVNKYKELRKTSIDKLVNKCKELGTTDISKLVDGGKELGDVGKDETGVSKLSEKYKKLTDIVSKARMVFDAFKKGLTIVADFQKTEQKFGNMFGGAIGDLEKGNALFDHISIKARKSSLSLEEMASSTQSFLGVANNVGQLDRLNNMSERLAVLNTTGQSSSGATAAINEVMTGNYDSLTTKFNISDKEIENSGLMLNVNSGNIDGALDALDELLSKAGYSQSALDGVTGNVMTQGGMFAENLKTKFAESMSHVADIFANIMEKINGVLESGKIQPFIDAFAIAFSIIGYTVSLVVDLIIWLGDVASQSWSILEPILMAIAIYFLPTIISALPAIISLIWGKVTALWAAVVPVLAQAVAWVALYAPILLVIGAIALVIFILAQLGVTAGDICGFIGGVFGILGARIYNIVAFWWNMYASFAEFLANLFINPVAAVQKLFYDMALNIWTVIQNVMKGVEGLINKIPGVNIDITSGIDGMVDYLNNKISDIEQKNDFYKMDRMEMKDLGDAASKGFEFGSGLYDKASGAVGNVLGKLLPGKKGGLLNADTVLNNKGGFPSDGIPNTKLDNMLKDGVMPVKNGGTGGSLDVAIDKEDIKYLKDIAERDYIAKYSTATLAPNVQITFGDIHETADANKVAGVIEKLLKEEIAIVAEGV